MVVSANSNNRFSRTDETEITRKRVAAFCSDLTAEGQRHFTVALDWLSRTGQVVLDELVALARMGWVAWLTAMPLVTAATTAIAVATTLGVPPAWLMGALAFLAGSYLVVTVDTVVEALSAMKALKGMAAGANE